MKKKPKKPKSKILKGARKMAPGSFVPFDNKTCMPINTEGFTEEDWKQAMECSATLRECQASDKSNRRAHISIFIWVCTIALAFWLGTLVNR